MCTEIGIRSEEARGWGDPRTLYFGGGTPSLLLVEDGEKLFRALHAAFPDAVWDEVTLEANPEDITVER